MAPAYSAAVNKAELAELHAMVLWFWRRLIATAIRLSKRAGSMFKDRYFVACGLETVAE
jgi:hypothetical protein